MSAYTPFESEYFSNRPPIETTIKVVIGREGECDMPDACVCVVGCSLHTAAPALLEALERMCTWINLDGLENEGAVMQTRAAIAQAKESK